MALIRWGSITAAGDFTMAAIVNQSGSRTRAAISSLLEQVAGAIIAADPTLITAATGAVSTALGQWGIDQQDDEEFVVKDRNQRTAFKVHRDGSTSLAGARYRPGSSKELVIVDSQQRVAVRVRPDGSVEIPHLVGRGGGDGGAEVLKVVLEVMIGQSNAEGRGRPTSARLDPQDARIRMYDWPTGTLKLATVPLSSPQQQVGISPATPIARRFVAESPNTVVVVLNAGVGGSGLVATPTQGCWKVGYTGSNPALYSQTVTALQSTIGLIQAQYGLTPEVWFYWHQGESDSSISEASYAAALDELIAGFRGVVGDPTAPFTIGGLVPERIEANPGLVNIRKAHLMTPTRVPYTAYADGVANGGGSADPADIVHYNRGGALVLGDAMFDASQRAASASDDQVPHKPLTVDARLAGGTLTVSWSAPDTRFTSFVVEYRIGAGSWVSKTTTTPELFTTFAGVSGSPVEVRVSSRNGTAASQPTLPVLAH